MKPQFVYDYMTLADALASALGVSPQLQGQQDSALYELLQNGPLLPSHFRLHGPGAKPQLASALLLDALSTT